MTILFFGTYNVETTPRVKVLMEGCTTNDIEVIECNAPLPLNTSQRVAILKAPWRLPFLILRLTECWLKLILKRIKAPKSDAILIGNIGQFDIRLAKVLFRKRHLILDYMISAGDTAKDRGENGGIKLSLLNWLDNAALKRADTILVDTEEHKATVPEKYRGKVVVVHVGASNIWFKDNQSKDTNKPLKVIFFGSFTPLQGAPIIGEAISKLNGNIHISMIGSGQDEEATKLLATLKSDSVSVDWKQWLGTNELVKAVSQSDVCLGIFGDNPKAKRVVPNKIYQGAASGCALITSNTLPQSRILGDAAILIPPADPNALANAIDDLSKNRSKVIELQKKSKAKAEIAFKPKVIVEPLITRLSKV